jgi:hypothetical protein
MSELYPEIPPQTLRETAGHLFGEAPFTERQVDLKRGQWEGWQWRLPAVAEGEVPQLVFDAITTEIQRAEGVATEKNEQLSGEWREWYARPIGRVVWDALAGRKGPAHNVQPEPQVSGDAQQLRRTVRAYLGLGKGWPDLTCEVTEWSFAGTLDVAGRQFPLDSAPTSLEVALLYPLSDGTRTDWVVSHKLPAYINEVQTRTSEGSGAYWIGIPCEPFTDTPAPSSYYMNCAMEMAAEPGRYRTFS